MGDNIVFWVLIIGGAMALVSLMQVLGNSGLGVASARNLFLGVRLTAESSPHEQTVWVRALDNRSLLVVSPKLLGKGERVRVNLASLPDYPSGDGLPLVDAEVVRVRVIRGSPDSFLVRLRFARMAPGLGGSLTQYVRRLAERSRMQHA